jgi:hypothetical protein
LYQSAGTEGVVVVTVVLPTAAHPFCSEAGVGVGETLALDDVFTVGVTLPVEITLMAGVDADLARLRYATISLPVDTIDTSDQPSSADAFKRSGSLACSLA